MTFLTFEQGGGHDRKKSRNFVAALSTAHPSSRNYRPAAPQHSLLTMETLVVMSSMPSNQGISVCATTLDIVIVPLSVLQIATCI